MVAGVTYPRRRTVSSGGGRLPILAALFLAVAGLMIGAFLVLLARQGPQGTFVAVVSPTPVSSLPVFTQPTPIPTAAPSPPPFVSFPPLPTPGPVETPSDSPGLTPFPTDLVPTPTPTVPPVTLPPSKTPKPPSPTPPPPTPTPPPAANCSNATGTPTNHVTLSSEGKKNQRVLASWCVDRVEIHILFGSTYGDVALSRDSTPIYAVNCEYPGCTADNTKTFGSPKLWPTGSVARGTFTCTGDPNTETDECADPAAFKATIDIWFEVATP
jgi:hypothetical protein